MILLLSIDLFITKTFSNFQASFLLSATEHGTQDRYELSNMVNKYQLLVYLADSLFDDEQYKRAEVCML